MMENENVVDDFDSGFLDTPATLTETPEEVEVIESPVVESPKLAEITEEQFKQLQDRLSEIDQIKEVTAKRIDTAFGKLGGIERVINQLQSSTPDGEAVNISSEDFADLAADYPEIAALQIAGLNKVLGKMKGTGKQSFDQDQLNKLVEQKLGSSIEKFRQEHEEKSEFKLLDMVQNDWRDVVGMPDENNVVPNTEFRQWLATQDPAYQDTVNDAWDARVIQKAISKFKEAKQVVKSNHKSDRQKQLQAAANTPRSAGGHPTGPSEDDDFDAGFRS